MTNLRPGASQSWLNRERALVGSPLALSGAVCLGLVVAVVLPSLDRIRELNTAIVDFEAKKGSLPALQAQLDKATEKQQVLLNQQMLLVDLIAGQDRIATFLALLEQQASATNVTIVRYEPIAASPSSSETPGTPSSQQDDQSLSDPMQSLGYRQTAVALGVRGGYESLQRFLQRMEDLEILVEASDLQLQTRPARTPSQRPLTELGLRLSFFDRAPAPEADGDEVKATTSDH